VTKTQMINKIARTNKMTKKDAAKMVNTFCDTVVSNLKRNQRVSLAGFGSFSVRKGGGFTVRNPRTGISKKVAAYKEVCFSPAPSWNPKKKNTMNKKNSTKR
jgi:DNA-binding protein HU-beta